MKTPTIKEFEITDKNLLIETIHQIQKDWNRAGLSPLQIGEEKTANEVVRMLNSALNELVVSQPESLATLLYLIDLNEAKLIWESGQMTIDKLTEAIVRREFFKVKLRSML